MSPRPLRSRLLDLAVALVCIACVCAPFLATTTAAPVAPVINSSGTVDQRVLQSGIISNPINGSFGAGRSGRVDGAVSWDMYTTSIDGLKLLLASDRTPAMRDAQNGVDIADYAATPGEWSVAAGDRRFGFSVVGALGLDRFGSGARWRGLEGRRSVETARRRSTIARTRTTIKLRAEFSSALGSDARATANLTATAVPNL